MYKLIAIDMDGTLLNDNKQITEENVRVIKQAIQEGIKVVISSARSFYRLYDYLEELDLIKSNQYTICFNGAVIIENESERILQSKNFRADEVKRLIEIAKEYETDISLYAMNCLMTENIPEMLKRDKHFKNVNFKKIKYTTTDFDRDLIYKIVFVNEPEKILEIKSKLPQKLSNEYEITSSIPQYIEFVKKGITKANALQSVAAECKIKASEIIAVGDADNDIEMIKYAGLGVAMENASNNLKEKADYITASNNQDGIAKIIKKYML